MAQPALIDSFRMKAADSAFHELIDAASLAGRLNVPESWVRNHTWGGADDPIPHIKLGRYVRYRWGHPDLAAWLERRSIG
jgi:hypothetical protein